MALSSIASLLPNLGAAFSQGVVADGAGTLALAERKSTSPRLYTKLSPFVEGYYSLTDLERLVRTTAPSSNRRAERLIR
jgi:hypothetical protein